MSSVWSVNIAFNLLLNGNSSIPNTLHVPIISTNTLTISSHQYQLTCGHKWEFQIFLGIWSDIKTEITREKVYMLAWACKHMCSVCTWFLRSKDQRQYLYLFLFHDCHILFHLHLEKDLNSSYQNNMVSFTE